MELNLYERALRLKYHTGAALNSGSARFLPGTVVALIQEQAEVLALMAHELGETVKLVEQLQAGCIDLDAGVTEIQSVLDLGPDSDDPGRL